MQCCVIVILCNFLCICLGWLEAALTESQTVYKFTITLFCWFCIITAAVNVSCTNKQLEKQAQVRDITDLFYWFSKSHYPLSAMVAMNAGCVAVSISWVPLQCDSLLLWALLPQNPVAPKWAPAPEFNSKR